jgi:hypothetical protein
MDALKIIEPPGSINGRAFWTVQITPFTCTFMIVDVLLGHGAEGSRNYPAGIREDDIDASCVLANLLIKAVEIGHLGDIALDGGRMRAEQGGRRLRVRPW